MKQGMTPFIKAWLSFCVFALLTRALLKIFCFVSHLGLLLSLMGMPKDRALHVSLIIESVLTFVLAFFYFRWSVRRFLLRGAMVSPENP